MTATIFQILGGLALFLLAMEMMTDGLKSAAGHQLRHLLGHWTKTPLRGLAAGFLITGIVQHSGAVTVATIGFVNAGLLNLAQSLGIIFGSNIGTTMTAWLVSLVGFGFDIEAMALPLLAAGMGVKMISRNPRNRSLGQAFAGFALFFLGLSILKSSLETLAGGLDSDVLVGAGYGLPAFVLIGFLATVLTQSSSASLAIVLTAAAGGADPPQQCSSSRHRRKPRFDINRRSVCAQSHGECSPTGRWSHPVQRCYWPDRAARSARHALGRGLARRLAGP
tara:strand:- start:17545 stop:18381 length:837 start_codon:yes stop_codon:yes gene_type:complete